jgi:hypothetical protein
MDKLSELPDSKSVVSAVSARALVTSSVQESLQAKAAGESNPDAFWLILRELRVIGNKLDGLISGIEPGVFKKNSDKSYH